MGIIDKFKKITNREGHVDKDGRFYGDIYKDLGIIEPFTLLVDEQFSNFINKLSDNKLLNENEKKALNSLWYTACVDIDDFGNNIPFLKNGSFVIYDKDGIIIRFEKKESDLEYESGRANFVYLSDDGNFIIHQNERNRKAFLVYVFENITDRIKSFD